MGDSSKNLIQHLLEIAEIELKHLDETFELPEWIGDEVSDDDRYYNVCLLKKPYSVWG